MAKLSKIATDTDKASEGQWVEYCPAIDKDEPALEFKIARLGNPAYNQRLQSLVRPHRRKVRAGFESELEPFVKQAVAECCLVDWRGMQTDDGKSIKYSKKTSLEILTDPRYSDVYDFILDFASDAAIYREMTIEDSAENSRSSLNGASPTGATKKSG